MSAPDPFAGILLARHGQTNDNVPPIRFQGFRDTPLNDTGREQARELAERIVAEPERIRSLWSSDLSRARETAEIVGSAIGLTPRLDPRLREANRGEWEGHLFQGRRARRIRSDYASLDAGPARRFAFPGVSRCRISSTA